MDYKVLESCQFPIPIGSNDCDGCGEPASYVVWWADDGKDPLYVCPEHLAFIKTCENQENEMVIEGLRDAHEENNNA